MTTAKKRQSHRNTLQIFPRLSRETGQQFKRYCLSKGVTESSIIEAALREYLDDDKEMTLLFRRIDRLTHLTKDMQQDIQLLMEAFGIFVQIWFAHTAEIPESQHDTVRRMAWQRYRRFCETVATYAAKGHHFTHDVFPPEESREEGEKVPSDSSGPPPPQRARKEASHV